MLSNPVKEVLLDCFVGERFEGGEESWPLGEDGEEPEEGFGVGSCSEDRDSITALLTDNVVTGESLTVEALEGSFGRDGIRPARSFVA
jgi:hypothetical protein